VNTIAFEKGCKFLYVYSLYGLFTLNVINFILVGLFHRKKSFERAKRAMSDIHPPTFDLELPVRVGAKLIGARVWGGGD